MSLLENIITLYPNAVPFVDFTIQDNGYGPFISAWNINGPIPEGAIMGISAAQWFEEHHGELRADSQALIGKIDRIQDMLSANQQVAAAAAAAEPGAIIPGTGMVKEEVLMGLALIAVFRTFLATEVAAGITVRNAVWRLG
jgi:hypothetical protein